MITILKILLMKLMALYESFGYNNIIIKENKITIQICNYFFDIDEKVKSPKIKSIKFKGKNYSKFRFDEIIKSKVKKLTNIFANNNFKPED